MNWNITTEILGRGDRDVTVKVTAVKGEHTLERTFPGIVSEAGLKQAVQQWLQNWAAVQEFTPGVIDLTPPAPEPPKPPTQAELDRQEWTKDWQQLQAVTKLEANGVIILTAAQKTALVAKVRTNFKVEYQDIV